MPGFKDISEQKFGRLTVIERGPDYRYQYKNKLGRLARWICKCECGNEILVTGANLRAGQTQSCGCLQKEITVERSTIHGQAKRSGETYVYNTYNRAKQRAKKLGVRFDLKLEDIQIPKFCPVLGIELKPNKEMSGDSSPSVDRIHPERGYVKGNIQIISQRANQIKSDSTIEELEKLLNHMRQFEVFAYA